jgi:phenylacetate-CoA ligase
MMWNEEVESKSREEMKKLQLERLQAVVNYAYENVPY